MAILKALMLASANPVQFHDGKTFPWQTLHFSKAFSACFRVHCPVYFDIFK